jgi:hypothetical protein
MQCFGNALAYFTTAVSYSRKMFMKLTPGVNLPMPGRLKNNIEIKFSKVKILY